MDTSLSCSPNDVRLWPWRWLSYRRFKGAVWGSSVQCFSSITPEFLLIPTVF